MKFQGKISYKPSSPTDPVPWLAWLYVDGKETSCRWCGTREEAHDALTAMQHGHGVAFEGDLFDLPPLERDPRDVT